LKVMDREDFSVENIVGKLEVGKGWGGFCVERDWKCGDGLVGRYWGWVGVWGSKFLLVEHQQKGMGL